MNRRKVSVTVDGSIVAVTGWRAQDMLQSAGMRPIYVGTRRVWLVDRRRLPDVLAALEHHDLPVTLTREGP